MSEEENKGKETELEIVNIQDAKDAPEEVKDAPKEEVVEKKPEEKKKPKLSKFADIFVTEQDTFDITVQYYKEAEDLIVCEVDDAFSESHECIEFVVTFKYPNQGDATLIGSTASSMAGNLGTSLESLDIRDFLSLELARVLTLVRKWTIDKDLTNQSFLNLHPKVVKSIITQVRNKIGMDGII